MAHTKLAPKKVSFKAIGVVIVVMVMVSVSGASLTDLGPWYQALTLPDWQPPGPAFGIIWTTIYVLTAISVVITWRTIHSRREAITMIALHSTNCVLNVMWSFLFFALHRPDYALYQVGFFWLSIIALIVFAWPRTKFGAILMAPYIIWVSIASYLNLTIVQLNAPFMGK
jgi:translocator protein